MNHRLLISSVAAALLVPAPFTSAQTPPAASPSFAGHYVPGVEGIKAASLPPPGFYVRDYNIAYFSDRLNDRHGDEVPVSFDALVYANLLRPIWITEWKVLGGNVGADMIIPFVYTDLSVKAGGNTLYDHSLFAVGDLYFEPITLSWHGARYDAAFGYSFFAPTADAEVGTAEAGKGFWTQMLTLGGTVYLDAARTWSLSALNRYEFNTEERQTEITPGQIWTIEWGIGKALTKAVDLGVAGYYQLQTSKDSGIGASNARDQVAGMGPELSMFCPKLGLFTSVRYAFEFATEDRPQGNTAVITLTRRF